MKESVHSECFVAFWQRGPWVAYILNQRRENLEIADITDHPVLAGVAAIVTERRAKKSSAFSQTGGMQQKDRQITGK